MSARTVKVVTTLSRASSACNAPGKAASSVRARTGARRGCGAIIWLSSCVRGEHRMLDVLLQLQITRNYGNHAFVNDSADQCRQAEVPPGARKGICGPPQVPASEASGVVGALSGRLCD